MKLIQMNFWNGRLFFPLKRFLEAEKPDFISGQEIADAPSEVSATDHWVASMFVTQKLVKDYALASERPFYEDRMESVKETVNVGVLSQTPIVERKIIDIIDPEEFKINRYLPQYAQLLHATVSTLDGPDLHIMTYQGRSPEGAANIPHFGRMGYDKVDAEFERIADYMTMVDGPKIFAGDMNLWQTAPVFQSLKKKTDMVNLVEEYGIKEGRNEFAWGGNNEIVSHMFVTPDIKVDSFCVAPQDVRVSDHQPLILEFRL